MTQYVIAALAALALSGCHPSPPQPPAGVDCHAAATRLVQLQCDEGKPTP